MFASFKGKVVDLYNDNMSIIRRFQMKAEVVNASINGSGKDAQIAITMKDGHFEVYKSNGSLVRRG